MIKQRTIDGLRAAEEAGKRIGRPIGFTSEDRNLPARRRKYERAVQAIVARRNSASDRRIQRQIGVPRRAVLVSSNDATSAADRKGDDELAEQARDDLKAQ